MQLISGFLDIWGRAKPKSRDFYRPLYCVLSIGSGIKRAHKHKYGQIMRNALCWIDVNKMYLYGEELKWLDWYFSVAFLDGAVLYDRYATIPILIDLKC